VVDGIHEVPDEVFPVSFPMSHLFSARSYLDKHGPDERYNLMKYLKDVRCPLLIMAGSLEDHPRLRDCAVDMHKLVKDRAECQPGNSARGGPRDTLECWTVGLITW